MATHFNDSEELELMKDVISDLRLELEGDLQGLVACDYITRQDEAEVLEDFDNWAETAGWNDTYYYDESDYVVKKPEDEM